MTVTRPPHSAVRSSGSEVSTVAGPGAASAVALSMASMAYVGVDHFHEGGGAWRSR